MSTGGFANPVAAAGGALVIDSIHSPNYNPGVDGWSIDQDGSAEFNNVTIRGNISLSPLYAPVTSVYDASGGGAPAWNVVNTFVLFSGVAWAPVDLPCPSSGRFRVDILITGMNNNTAASTLHTAIECVESSPPETGPGWTAPGTPMNSPNTDDSARVSSFVAGTAATVRATSYLILDGLVPGNIYRFRPYWRISSGNAASVTFADLSSRFTVSAIV